MLHLLVQSIIFHFNVLSQLQLLLTEGIPMFKGDVTIVFKN